MYVEEGNYYQYENNVIMFDTTLSRYYLHWDIPFCEGQLENRIVLFKY